MNERNAAQRLAKWVVLSLLTILSTFVFTDEVRAQVPSPFLHSPYYGSFGISQGFIPGPNGHEAYDYLLRYDQVLAAATGTVEFVGWANHDADCMDGSDIMACGFGLYVMIHHAATDYRTIYAHLSSTAFDFSSIGTTVNVGQVIGTSGNTGWSSGPHLHFEVENENDDEVDPYDPDIWKDGEAAIPSRPLLKPATVTTGEIIVDDNGDNTLGFSKGSGGPFNSICPPNSCPNWTRLTGSSGAPDYMHLSDMYHTPVNNLNNSYWAKWAPPGLPAGGGTYEIFVHVPNRNTRSGQAPYTIVHASGSTTTRVAQGSLPNGTYSNSLWVSIGAYHLMPGNYVYTTSATGEDIGFHCGAGVWCQLNVDAIKFVRLSTTHLPLIKTGGGWTTNIHVRSNSGTAQVRLVEYNSAGQYVTWTGAATPPRGATMFGVYNTTVASIAVNSSQDVSVIAELKYNGEPAGYNGLTSSDGPGSAGWERVGATLYVPLVKRNWYGRSSQLYVTNVGLASTTVSVTYTKPSGTDCSGSSILLAPNAQTVYAVPSGCGDNYYAAKITSSSGDPLAIVVYEGDGTTPGARPAMYNAFNSSSRVLYAPQVKKNYFEHTTGITIQNTSSASTNGTTSYYDMDGFSAGSVTNIQISPRATYALVDPQQIADGFLGSAFLNFNPQAITAVMTESNITFGGDRRMMSNLHPSGGSLWVILPLWYDRYLSGGADWRSGVNVRNVGTGSTDLTAYFYDIAGNLVHTATSILGSSTDTNNFWDNAPDNARYTVLIVSSSHPIVAVENIRDYAGTSGDTNLAVNGSNR